MPLARPCVTVRGGRWRWCWCHRFGEMVCELVQSRGGLCITDGASECQGQAVHFFARLWACVLSGVGARTTSVGLVLWFEAPSCVHHLSMIGVLARGYRANLLFFFLLLLLFSPLLLPFVFSFSVFGLMFMWRDGESARWIMFGIRGLFRWRLCKWGILGSGRVLFSVLLAKATLIGFMALYHVNFSFD